MAHTSWPLNIQPPFVPGANQIAYGQQQPANYFPQIGLLPPQCQHITIFPRTLPTQHFSFHQPSTFAPPKSKRPQQSLLGHDKNKQMPAHQQCNLETQSSPNSDSQQLNPLLYYTATNCAQIHHELRSLSPLINRLAPQDFSSFLTKKEQLLKNKFVGQELDSPLIVAMALKYQNFLRTSSIQNEQSLITILHNTQRLKAMIALIGSGTLLYIPADMNALTASDDKKTTLIDSIVSCNLKNQYDNKHDGITLLFVLYQLLPDIFTKENQAKFENIMQQYPKTFPRDLSSIFLKNAKALVAMAEEQSTNHDPEYIQALFNQGLKPASISPTQTI